MEQKHTTDQRGAQTNGYGRPLAIAPMVCIGTTDNFHYWRDANGKIFSSIDPCAGEEINQGVNGLRFRFDDEQEFNEERRLDWQNYRSYAAAQVAK